MIDIEKAKKEFIKYTNQFDINNAGIARKIGHSLRVMEISNQIAQSLELEEEQIQLATLIGLLHDIARFEQMRQYNTFEDGDSIDHGDYGVEILNKDIRKYIDINKYDTIIKKAVKNHNKFQIEDGLTDEELLFSKIIRDSDKIDILYEATCMFWVEKEKEVSLQSITDKVIEQCLNKETIKNEVRKNELDKVICIISLIYDINYKESFEMIKKEEYVDKILNRFDFKNISTKENIEKVRREVKNYISEKTK